MKKLIFLFLCLIPFITFAQVCPGPGGCEPTTPFQPPKLCIRDVCTPVTYTQLDKIVIAQTSINGYNIIGWAGPCLQETVNECGDIFNQAFTDLYINTIRAIRVSDFVR